MLDHTIPMHKTSWYMYIILIRVLPQVCVLHSALKIGIEGDIQVVIIHCKFRKDPLITVLIILITNRQTDLIAKT